MYAVFWVNMCIIKNSQAIGHSGFPLHHIQKPQKSKSHIYVVCLFLYIIGTVQSEDLW